MHVSSRPIRFLAEVVDVLAIGIIGIALAGVVLGRVLPALGHPVYVVGGPSMTPALGLGDAIILDQVDAASLAVGDVVSLRNGPTQAVYTHRIIRVAERDGEIWFETKGDANASPDPAISPASAVIGRVSHVVPEAGYLLALMSMPIGVVFMLATGTLLIALGWSLDGLDADRRRTALRVAHRAAVAAIVATPVAAAPSHVAGGTTPPGRRAPRSSRSRV
jgi:signal peptidase